MCPLHPSLGQVSRGQGRSQIFTVWGLLGSPIPWLLVKKGMLIIWRVCALCDDGVGEEMETPLGGSLS